MLGINQVTIVGTLTVDPDIRTFGDSNKKRANLLVAVNEKEQRVNKETGEVEWKDITRFVVAEFWGGQAGYIEKYVNKGTNVAITGKIARQSWEDKESGAKKNKTIIEGQQIVILTSQKPSKKETAKAVIAYMEDLKSKGIDLNTGLEELKGIVAAAEGLAAQAF